MKLKNIKHSSFGWSFYVFVICTNFNQSGFCFRLCLCNRFRFRFGFRNNYFKFRLRYGCSVILYHLSWLGGGWGCNPLFFAAFASRALRNVLSCFLFTTLLVLVAPAFSTKRKGSRSSLSPLSVGELGGDSLAASSSAIAFFLCIAKIGA